MAFSVVYKPLALLEAKEAYDWYAQGHINMHAAFLEQLTRTDSFLSANPYLYPCVEKTIRRANLNQFPYALFYVIDEDTVNVLSCFHQLRDPKSWK